MWRTSASCFVRPLPLDMSGMGGCTRKQISCQHSSRGYWDAQAHWSQRVGDPSVGSDLMICRKQQLLAGIWLIPKKSTELSKLTQCGKTATSLGPGSTLGEKGEKKLVWAKNKIGWWRKPSSSLGIGKGGGAWRHALIAANLPSSK